MSERRVELTSSGWLFGPKQFFWLVNELNRDRPPERQIGVELYPVHYFRGWPLGRGRISADKIHAWKEEYKNVPIERIHLPFHWDLPSASANFFYHSFLPLSSRYEPGTPLNRLIAAGAAYMMGTVQNKFAMQLAYEFRAGFNAHVYIIEEAAKRGRLGELRSYARKTLVENDLDYPRSKREQLMAERDPQRAIRAAEKHGLEGVILGLDHDFLNGLDPIETLESNLDGLRKHLRAVHLAGQRGFRGLITEQDQKLWEAVDFINGEFAASVALCLDLSPLAMGKLSPNEQLIYIKDLLEKLQKAA